VAIEEIHSIRGREIQTAKELLKEGYTSEQLLAALAGKTLDEKSRLWASGGIRDLLHDIRPGLPPESEAHKIDYQAWFITRRPKESFRDNGSGMFVAPEMPSEPVVTMELAKVIDQGVQAVFERESIVPTDVLLGEIVRLAPGQASNSEIEAALKDRDEFVRKKIGDHEMITTRAIIAKEEAIIGGVKSGMGRKAALMSEAEYETPDELIQAGQADPRITLQKLPRLKAGSLSASTSALTLPNVVSGLCFIPS
jgi:hypothetical protein